MTTTGPNGPPEPPATRTPTPNPYRHRIFRCGILTVTIEYGLMALGTPMDDDMGPPMEGDPAEIYRALRATAQDPANPHELALKALLHFGHNNESLHPKMRAALIIYAEMPPALRTQLVTSVLDNPTSDPDHPNHPKKPLP